MSERDRGPGGDRGPVDRRVLVAGLGVAAVVAGGAVAALTRDDPAPAAAAAPGAAGALPTPGDALPTPKAPSAGAPTTLPSAGVPTVPPPPVVSPVVPPAVPTVVPPAVPRPTLLAPTVPPPTPAPAIPPPAAPAPPAPAPGEPATGAPAPPVAPVPPPAAPSAGATRLAVVLQVTSAPGAARVTYTARVTGMVPQVYAVDTGQPIAGGGGAPRRRPRVDYGDGSPLDGADGGAVECRPGAALVPVDARFPELSHDFRPGSYRLGFTATSCAGTATGALAVTVR